jgi:hypothetical protein
MYREIVDLTLPGSWTPQDAMVFLNGMTMAVTVTRDSQLYQIGQITEFYVGLLADSTKVLSASIYSDVLFDVLNAEAMTVQDTPIGDLTVGLRERSVLLPLVF